MQICGHCVLCYKKYPNSLKICFYIYKLLTFVPLDVMFEIFSKSHTTNATKYVLILTVVLNTSCSEMASIGVVFNSSVLNKDRRFLSRVIFMENVAFS